MTRGRRFFLLGLAAAVAATALLLATRRPAAGEPLTEAGLAEARALWERRRPASYAMEVEVRGVQSARHRIEVRDGVVASMTTDGRPVDARVREQWSVEGMFRFLADEIRNLERADAAYGATDSGDVLLRAEFDPELGYPRRFLRHVLGTGRGVEWEVLRLDAGP